MISRQEDIRAYLRKYYFKCSETDGIVKCHYDEYYIFKPILFGKRINPDIDNHILIDLGYPKKDEKNIQPDLVHVTVKRYLYQDRSIIIQR